MVNAAFESGGGGSLDLQEVRISGERHTNDSPPSASWEAEFSETITKHQIDASGDEWVESPTARGQVGYHWDQLTGMGEVVVRHLGNTRDGLGPEDTIPFEVIVDGETLGTLETGERMLIPTSDQTEGGTVTEDDVTTEGDPNAETPSIGDDADESIDPFAESSESVGGLLDFVPELLPGIGPLSSRATTALAVVVGLAVVGSLAGG